MEKISEIYALFMSEPENKMCIDCMRPYPKFASINNGIFLCEECALIHKDYGFHISYIKSLDSEWDEYLLSYMRRGGNRRFKQFLEDYDIIENAERYYKYRTKAVENFRSIVKLV